MLCAPVKNIKTKARCVSAAISLISMAIKSSNRKATSALVLTGGWVESLYLACELYAEKPDKEILKRIGIQRESISSIVSILTTYNNEGESDALIDQISGLQSSFDEIGMEYEYSATETNEAKHFSQIHHSLEIKISPQVMKDIRAKVAAIREGIINTSNT